MTDTQLLTTCITLLGIFTAMMVNNHRINHLDRGIDDTRDLLRAESKAEFARVDAHFAALESKLDRYHETVLRMLADLEGRIR